MKTAAGSYNSFRYSGEYTDDDDNIPMFGGGWTPNSHNTYSGHKDSSSGGGGGFSAADYAKAAQAEKDIEKANSGIKNNPVLNFFSNILHSLTIWDNKALDNVIGECKPSLMAPIALAFLPMGERTAEVSVVEMAEADIGLAGRGYRPKAGERTLEGFLKNNTVDGEVGLYTDSAGFNSNNKGVGGQFKRFGRDSHGGVEPHVHQPIRKDPKNGSIYGTTGTKTKDGGVTTPMQKDIKQLYDFLFNDKYKK